MVKIIVKPGEQLPIVLRKFRKLCEKAEVVKDFKKHEFYEKPSDRKRRDRRRNVKKIQKSIIE